MDLDAAAPSTDALPAPTPALAEMQEVARLRAERDHLTRLHARAKVDAEAAHARVVEASAQLTREKADVEALEKMSLTRVLSAVRGRRLDDLEREQAEVRAAEYTYATAHARWQEAVAEEARLVARLNAIGALDQRWERALVARESELGSGSPEGFRLGSIAQEAGRLSAEAREIREAQDAAAAAQHALRAAATKLSSAGSWATYDTFFGGGMMADMVKHQRLDQASELIRAADAALHHLGTELADVGVTPVGGIGVSELSRTLDFWFDNIFTDWSVANRISEARTRVDAALEQTQQIGHLLALRAEDVHRATDELRLEREQTLLG